MSNSSSENHEAYSNSLSSSPTEALAQVRKRFQCDFLPQFGGVWRQMMPTTATADPIGTSSTTTPLKNKEEAREENNNVKDNSHVPEEEKRPSKQKHELVSTKKKSTPSPDFLQAIEKGKATKIQIKEDGCDDCIDINCLCDEEGTPLPLLPSSETASVDLSSEGQEDLRDAAAPMSHINLTPTKGKTSHKDNNWPLRSTSSSSSIQSSNNSPLSESSDSFQDCRSVLSSTSSDSSSVNIESWSTPNRSKIIAKSSTSFPRDPASSSDCVFVDLVDSSDEEEVQSPKSDEGRNMPREGSESVSTEEAEWIDEDSLDGSDDDTSSVEFLDNLIESTKGLSLDSNKTENRHPNINNSAKFSTTKRPSTNVTVIKLKSKSSLSKREFKKCRESLSKRIFTEFNRSAFDGMLSAVEVSWSVKLRTTAGITRLTGVRVTGEKLRRHRQAVIELSTKVLDNEDRLRTTLLHEMVHAAAWIIDGVCKPPHGDCFKKWAKIAMSRIPNMKVTTTHDYVIEFKYAWACMKPGCSFVVKRHSRSVDVTKHCCGRCRGKLVEVDASGDLSKMGKPQPKRKAKPSAYNLFVKKNSKSIRSRLVKERMQSFDIRGSKVSQADVMRECGRMWAAQKAESATNNEYR